MNSQNQRIKSLWGNKTGWNRRLSRKIPRLLVRAGASGLSFDIDQTTATINSYVSIAARLSEKLVIEGMNIDLSKAASHVIVEGYDFGSSVVALGTTNTAWIFELISCQFESAAFTSGGNASVITNAQACAKVTSGAIGAIALGDFDATVGSENLQAGTLAV